MSNDKGEYKFKGLSAGELRVIARSLGLQTQEKTITLTAGTEQVLDFTLKETAAQLEAVDIISSRANKFVAKKVIMWLACH